MSGHGGPTTSRASSVYCAGSRVLLVGLMLWAFNVSTAAAQETTLRLRIAWGGGAEQRWQGTIGLSHGELAAPRALGVEADEPGSIWLEEGQVRIRQRSMRTYDGVDVDVTAPLNAQLSVELAPQNERGKAARFEFSLRELAEAHQSRELDGLGNRLLVRRSPGDALRVNVHHDSLVFAPGETLRMDIVAGAVDGETQRLQAEVCEARTRRAVSEPVAIEAGPTAAPVDIVLPVAEGVYDVVVSTAVRGLSMRLGLNRRVTERIVQVIVVDDKLPVATETGTLALKKLVEIDPASNPRWWERLTALPLVPGLRRGPLGNGDAHSWQHSLGNLIQLGPQGREPNLSWEAYALPINRPGIPHVLEIEYPSDVPQTMGVSIVEPNAADVVIPIGLDSGVYLPDAVAGETPTWQRHRLLFWPRTKSPTVLITNRREGSQAVYRQIRVYEGPTRLPRRFAEDQAPQGRRLAGYYDQPLFPENYSAAESLDQWSGRSLDDWLTFYQGASRLVDYCHHVGYDALMLSVLADGSAIYPSPLLQPTPRYDTGTFFDSGQDPIRKDVVELLLRLFERDGLELIPVLDFSAPLPELEAVLREGGAQAEGLEWVGADGQAKRGRLAQGQVTIPCYNALHPRVQQAVLAVVRELAERYADREALAGVALNLAADTYVQLPGANWGYDDQTIGRFVQETGVSVPGAGEGRHAIRAAALQGELSEAWIAWRAAKIAEFHARIHLELARVRPGLKLYLAGTQMLDHADLYDELRPALPRRMSIEDAVRRVGIAPEQYQRQPDIVLLRPMRIRPTAGLSVQQAIDQEFNETPDLDRHFRDQATPASLLFHQPLPARLPSFDEKSPFRSTYTWLLAQLSPSGDWNRRRFAHSLATIDAWEMFDGGAMLALGQEESLRDFVDVYRRLPAARFETVPHETQPVTIRTLTRDGQTYIYLVNDSPWPAQAQLRLAAPENCEFSELGTTGRVDPWKRVDGKWRWNVALRPYDLLAVRLAAPQVQVESAEVTVDESVPGDLELQVMDLGTRAVALQKESPLDVLANADFESESLPGGELIGWQLSGSANNAASVERTNPHGGTQSLRLSSVGPVTSLSSETFAAPATGRLSMLVWLRVIDPARQPTLRLAVEGQYDGQEYYRYAPVGAGEGVNPIAAEWTQYEFLIDDLPHEGLSDLRVRIDLMDAGEVFIDDVQIHALRFSAKEYRELSKIVSLANVKLQEGQLSDCARVLESYWPQFLMQNVALTEGPLASRPSPAVEQSDKPPVASEPEPAEESSGIWGRLKRFVPSINPF